MKHLITLEAPTEAGGTIVLLDLAIALRELHLVPEKLAFVADPVSPTIHCSLLLTGILPRFDRVLQRLRLISVITNVGITPVIPEDSEPVGTSASSPAHEPAPFVATD